MHICATPTSCAAAAVFMNINIVSPRHRLGSDVMCLLASGCASHTEQPCSKLTSAYCHAAALMDDMISSRKLPLDAGFGFFMFITTPDISVKKGNDEFCTRFCGFHTAFSYRGTQGRGRVKYAVVGATSR